MKNSTVIVVSLMSLFMLGLSGQPGFIDAVRPDQPQSYLNQGEQLVAIAQTPEDRRISRQVLAMGVAISVDQGDATLASSCCIALASSYSENVQMQQQLWDLALQIDPSRLPQWAQFRPGSAGSAEMKRAAECLRLARHEDTELASSLYRQPGIKTALIRTGNSLGFSSTDIEEALRPLLVERLRDPCRGSYFRTVVENGESVREVCDIHRSPIGTTRDSQTLFMLLRIEAACLDASKIMGDWGAVSSLGKTAPARAPDLAWLIETTGIDIARPYLRNSRWVSNP
jgi:hypothetical protein